MKLYYSPTSPYVRTVMIVLHEVGAVDQVELVAGSGTAIDPGTAPIEANPLGKVPALELTDGTVLHDSRTICRYLADRYQPSLYPNDGHDWAVLTMEAMANGMMDAAYLMVMESRVRPEDKRFEAWIEGQWDKISRSLDHLEAKVDTDLLSGAMHIGQLALGSALGYLDLRHSDRHWRNGRPKLTSWAERLAERPALLATRPPA